jgi:hypothetical protein
LKSDIQTNIYVKRLKTKKGQTEFGRVPTLIYYSKNDLYLIQKFRLKFLQKKKIQGQKI